MWQSQEATASPKLDRHSGDTLTLMFTGQGNMKGHLGGARATEVAQDAHEAEGEGEEHPALSLFPPSYLSSVSTSGSQPIHQAGKAADTAGWQSSLQRLTCLQCRTEKWRGEAGTWGSSPGGHNL